MSIEHEDITALRTQAAVAGDLKLFATCCVALGEADTIAELEAGHIGQDDAWWVCVDAIEAARASKYDMHLADWYELRARVVFSQYKQQLSDEGLTNLPAAYIIAHRSDKATELQRQYRAHLAKAHSIQGGAS